MVMEGGLDTAGPEPSLPEDRLLAMHLLAFAGFLRCGVAEVGMCEFNVERLVLHIIQ